MDKIIPVTLITGFLGSGKTSLINKILKMRPETKISVILNEFGDVSLESQFIKGHEGDIFELSNGCMCCVAQEDFVRVVRWILEQKPDTEYVLIEASGASDPLPVISTFRESDISHKIQLSTVTCVVDGVNFFESKEKFKTVLVQLSNSDMAFISKVEEAGVEKVKEVESFIRQFIPRMFVGKIDDSFDVDLLFDSSRNAISLETIGEASIEEEHDHDQNHAHFGDGIESFVWKSQKALDFNKVNSFLRQLPAEVVRVKGVLNLEVDGVHKKFLLQYVGERSEVMEDDWKERESPYNAIVCVGRSFDKDSLLASLEKCVVE